jgi:hypothetical protein
MNGCTASSQRKISEKGLRLPSRFEHSARILPMFQGFVAMRDPVEIGEMRVLIDATEL